MEDLSTKVVAATRKSLFLELVVSGRVSVAGREVREIVTQLQEEGLEGSEEELERFLSTPLKGLTQEALARQRERKEHLDGEVERLTLTDAAALWKADLDVVEAAVSARYPPQ